MPVNLGSNKSPYKKGPGGKVIPNKPEGSSADTALANRGTGATGYDELGMNVSSKYRGGQQSTSQDVQSKGEYLRFPVDNIQAYPAYINFQPYKVDAYEIDEQAIADLFDVPLIQEFLGGTESTNDNQVATGFGNDPGGEFGGAQADVARRNAINGAGDEAAAQQIIAAKKDKAAQKQADAGRSRNRYTSDLVAQADPESNNITLYLPQSLLYQDTVQYRDIELGQRGLTGLSAINSGQGLAASVMKGLSDGITDIFKIFTGGLPQQGGELLAARLINTLPGGGGVQGAASTALQTGLNPGTRILFDRPALRNFTFNFKLIPRSPGEAEQIQKIIKSFREEMYPEALTVAGIPLGYKFPNTYYISMGIAGTDIKLPRIQYCYLRDVGITYNGTSGVFMEDGQPNEVDLALTFQEYRPLTKQDVQAGY